MLKLTGTGMTSLSLSIWQLPCLREILKNWFQHT